MLSYDRYGNKREEEGRKAMGVKTNEGEKNIVVLKERKHEVGGENITEGEKSKAAGLESGEGGSDRLKGGGNVSTDLVRKMAIGDRGFRTVMQTEQRYVPKYNSLAFDMEWASNGMVVSVLNGDAISVLQRRIYDAGFDKLVLIPLGANTVFLKTLDHGNVSTLLTEAAEFFDNFFSKPVQWNKDTLIRERGAWVRVYGVPLHAWNIDFF